jgi:anti-sigma-K factor RskA
MMRDHTLIEELLAIRSLGGLDADDARTLDQELAAHGECAECRELERSFGETAARLAFALDPQPVDPAMADRILTDRPVDVRTSDDGVSVGEPSGPRRAKRAWTALVGVAAAFGLLIGGIVVFGPRSTGIGDLQATQTIVRFEGEGTLAMAYVPGEEGAAIVGSGLPEPGPDDVYEIWMIDDDVPTSGGCVSPTDGSISVWIDADVSTADLMAVTVEPSSCPSQPTGTPISTAPLPVA